MPEEKFKTIQEHIESLPPYVKEGIRSVQPLEKIRVISQDFKLHIDEGERLQNEILSVMLGLTSPDEFIDKTSKTFGLSEEDSKKLVERVGDELFMPIRDVMRKYVEESSRQKEIVPTPDDAQKLSQPTPTALAQDTPHNPALVPTVPTKEETAIQAPRATPAVPTVPATPPPATKAVDDALRAPSAAPAEKMDVGISPAKPSGYKVDPYREPPV
jgi:hypothetical protein